MNSNPPSLGTRITAAVCAALLIPSNVVSSAVPVPQATTTTPQAAPERIAPPPGPGEQSKPDDKKPDEKKPEIPPPGE